MIAAIVTGIGTWLVLRTRVATLYERLTARDHRITELEERLAGQLSQLSNTQAELTQARQEFAPAGDATRGGTQGRAGKTGAAE